MAGMHPLFATRFITRRLLALGTERVWWIVPLVCAILIGQRVAYAQTLTVDISRPQAGQTILDNTGTVAVAVTLQGTELGSDKRLHVLLDGKPYGSDQSALEFTLLDVERGEHSLQVQVINTEHGVLAQSPVVKFQLFRASALFPSRKPNTAPVK